jgi:hypothetical protein
MIGVISKPDQTAVVEEFFELFKTPWEFCRQGRAYDVVLMTANEVPVVDAKLLLIYGPQNKSSDAADGITVQTPLQGGILEWASVAVPIYGKLAAFQQPAAGFPCVTGPAGMVGVRIESENATRVRLGYDLFEEVRFLLSAGQPIDHADAPTLDIHIAMLRNWILDAGIPVVEIPPVPAGHRFAVCLTHDIDFVGIRNHKFDHTMWGFLYRSTIGAVRKLLQGKISLARLLKIWRAAASLPFVHLGWVKDFWIPFEWYLQVEKNLPATYFLIPFKRHAGDHVPGRYAYRRACAYDVTDLPQWTAILKREGYELGVHGLDAWHSVEKGRVELSRIAEVSGEPETGIRMHWLLQNTNTASTVEQAGYAYDSTAGYNDTVGYRSGTAQVFRPLGATTLLELPLHIQDGALFLPEKLNLADADAEKRCRPLLDHAKRHGGVVTVLWHDRSHGPERFWGDFYVTLLHTLKSFDPWFGSAGQVVRWFRQRRQVQFAEVESADGIQPELRYDGDTVVPPFTVRIHRPRPSQETSASTTDASTEFVDIPWTGQPCHDVNTLLRNTLSHRGKSSGVENLALHRENPQSVRSLL